MSAIIKTTFCLAVLCLSSFVTLPFWRFDFVNDSYPLYDYSVQFILCYMIAMIFPKNRASFAVILFLVLGLVGFPIFANGGGWRYALEPSFAYLLALLPLAIFTHTYKKLDGFLFLPKSIVNNGAPLAIILAHLFAQIMLLVTARFSITNLISFSFYQLAYDLLLAIIFAAVYSFFNPREKQVTEPSVITTRHF